MRIRTKISFGMVVPLVAWVCSVLCLLAEAPKNLVLVATHADPNSGLRFGAALVDITGEGEAKLGRELISQEVGANWSVMARELGTMVFVTRSSAAEPRGEILVLDLARAEIVSRCAVPPYGDGWFGEWVTAAPWRGPSLSRLVVSPTSRQVRLESVSLVDCATKTDQGNLDVFSHAIVTGLAGAAVNHHPDVVRGVEVAGDGKLYLNLGRGAADFGAVFGAISPAVLRPERANCDPVGHILLNSSQAMVLQEKCAGKKPPPAYYILVKSRGAWRRFPATHLIAFRDFGRFLAGVETRERPPGFRTVRSKERRGRTKYGPDPVEAMAVFDGVDGMALPTGKLLVYDVRTEATYRINTGEPDSEILLIEGSKVYYRVNDELFQGDLVGGPGRESVTGVSRIAKGDLIQDCHWAFIRE